MEDRLEDANVAGPLASPHNWEDIESLAVWCRAAAALQPDGTEVPCKRCEVQPEPAYMSAHTVFSQHNAPLLQATVVVTYPLPDTLASCIVAFGS